MTNTFCVSITHCKTDGDKATLGFVVANAELALQYYRPDQLFLNTDCGFGCFSSRSVNVEEVTYKKLCAIVEAARQLRKKYS